MKDKCAFIAVIDAVIDIIQLTIVIDDIILTSRLLLLLLLSLYLYVNAFWPIVVFVYMSAARISYRTYIICEASDTRIPVSIANEHRVCAHAHYYYYNN